MRRRKPNTLDSPPPHWGFTLRAHSLRSLSNHPTILRVLCWASQAKRRVRNKLHANLRSRKYKSPLVRSARSADDADNNCHTRVAHVIRPYFFRRILQAFFDYTLGNLPSQTLSSIIKCPLAPHLSMRKVTQALIQSACSSNNCVIQGQQHTVFELKQPSHASKKPDFCLLELF